MRDQWYGDNRDIVKWGVLTQLAHKIGAARVLQVTYYRPTEWNGLPQGSWPELEIDGKPYPVPGSVLQHFRDVRRIEDIRGTPPIEVLEAPFEDRVAYQTVVLGALRQRPLHGPTVLFLDPDTGLASRHPDMRHVLDTELAAIWHELLPGDLLVFYQHQTNRNGQPWIPEKLAQFERALGLSSGSGKIASSPKIARDVVFFFCLKDAA
jgi:hypothetical protein